MRESTLTSGTRAEPALELMLRFAERTGLTSAWPPQRYLWTDAFAVCNFLGLDRTDLALRLVDQVHHTLGRHRDDDHRSGWISGLEYEDAEAHPTVGGLRIGKPMPERQPGEPFDEHLEWDRDGQYFHYLTRWMHALDQVTRCTGDPTFNRWARELAYVAHRAFTLGGRRMVWKLSIDLSEPLVPSMGHHDPLDGYVTCLQLEATAARFPDSGAPSLTDAITDYTTMIPSEPATADPLGIGGLLTDACRLDQLARQDAPGDNDLRDRLLDAARHGLSAYERSGDLSLPASMRLAFRELGLAIGLAAIPMISDRPQELDWFDSLRGEIESFWLRPEHHVLPTWPEHENINDVMLATSLAPDGYLTLKEANAPG